MLDEDIAALTDEELMELFVSLEAIDSTLTNKEINREGGSNDKSK